MNQSTRDLILQISNVAAEQKINETPLKSTPPDPERTKKISSCLFKTDLKNKETETEP